MTYELPNYIVFERGAIGETVNTTGCEPVMNGFDSRIAPQTKRNSSDNGGFFFFHEGCVAKINRGITYEKGVFYFLVGHDAGRFLRA